MTAPSRHPGSKPRQPSLGALENRYVLFRLRGVRGVQRRTLPLTLGSAGECDIVVNVSSASPLTYLVASDEAGRLGCFNAKTGERQPPAAVRAFGLDLLGSGRGAAPAAANLKTRLGELLPREAAWFADSPRLAALSPTVRRLLGASLPQSLRLSAWALGLTLCGALGLWAGGESSHPDLSGEPLALTFGSPRLEIIGASSQRFGYERGATLTFKAPAAAVSQSALLSFKTMALNLPRELVIELNGQAVYTSNVDPACVDTTCTKQIPIKQGILKADDNVLRLQHAPDAGSYMVKALLIEPLPPLTLEERELADRWLQLARRFYDERGIVADNLLAARIHMDKTLDLLTRRAPSDETASRLATARVLGQEIAVALDRAIKDAWADVGVHERLGRPEETSKALGILLRLFPDPSTREHQEINAKLEALKELRP